MASRVAKKHCVAINSWGNCNLVCFKDEQDALDYWKNIHNCAAKGYVSRSNRTIVTERYAAVGGQVINKVTDMIPWPMPKFPVEEHAREAEDFLRENARDQIAQ